MLLKMRWAAVPVVAALVNMGTAQADDTITPAIPGVVSGGLLVRVIKEGFSGTEGPLGLADGSFIFTETQAARITQIAEDGKLSTYLENTEGANGLALSPKGELFAVQTTKPQLAQLKPEFKVLAAEYEGKPFNRPNDLVLDSKGGIYFTDPGAAPKPGEPAPKTAVYYRKPSGELLRVVDDVQRPNGVELSPDEKTLYLANTAGDSLLAYEVQADGSLKNRRDFAKLEGFQKTATGSSGGADGIAIDNEGRVYVATGAGVEVFDAKGKALGVIELPKAPQNLAFAGKDKKTLYVVGRGGAYSFNTLTPGISTRAK